MLQHPLPPMTHSGLNFLLMLRCVIQTQLFEYDSALQCAYTNAYVSTPNYPLMLQ